MGWLDEPPILLRLVNDADGLDEASMAGGEMLHEVVKRSFTLVSAFDFRRSASEAVAPWGMPF